jgi:hypothetical protein
MDDIYSLQRSKVDLSEFGAELTSLKQKLDSIAEESGHVPKLNTDVEGLFQALDEKASVHELRGLSVELSKKMDKSE